MPAFYDPHTGKCVDATYHDWRGHFWNSLALLTGAAEQIALANRVLRAYLPAGDGHFWSSAVSSILARFSKRLDDDVRDALRARLEPMIANESQQRFRGYNDNFPAMAALATLVGGPLVGADRFIDGGLENLRSLHALLLRRGVLSEFSSPTYTPITMTCLAEIAELSPVAEARDLARAAEERCWADLCSRFHPATSTLAGPFSRAYNVDLCGHLHNAHVILYQVFGDAVRINPLNALFPYHALQVRHGGGHDRFIQAHAAWQMTPTYHVPDWAPDLALNKTCPTAVRASSEQAAFPRNFWSSERHPRTPLAEAQASAMHLYSYLDRDFAFGCQDRMFLDGYQATPFHAVYAKRSPALQIADVRTIFSRYVIDDTKPARDVHIHDAGRGNAVAHDASAMVLYRARPSWGMSAKTDYALSPVRSLKLSLTFPRMYGDLDEVWIGDRRAKLWDDASVASQPIFIRDGTLYLAIHPLLLADYGRPHAVEVTAEAEFGQISFVNYRGEPRTFSETELYEAHNGFVVEFASADTFESFDAFRAFHAAPVVRDSWRADDGMRTVDYERPGLSLGMAISPVSEGIKYRTANGRIVPEPKFHASGFDASLLPWI